MNERIPAPVIVDALIVRTGRHLRPYIDDHKIRERLAGLHASCAPWLRERGVAILIGDAVSDVIPSRVEGQRSPHAPRRQR